jgi:hypothetical protein
MLQSFRSTFRNHGQGAKNLYTKRCFFINENPNMVIGKESMLAVFSLHAYSAFGSIFLDGDWLIEASWTHKSFSVDIDKDLCDVEVGTAFRSIMDTQILLRRYRQILLRRYRQRSVRSRLARLFTQQASPLLPGRRQARHDGPCCSAHRVVPAPPLCSRTRSLVFAKQSNPEEMVACWWFTAFVVSTPACRLLLRGAWVLGQRFSPSFVGDDTTAAGPAAKFARAYRAKKSGRPSSLSSLRANCVQNPIPGGWCVLYVVAPMACCAVKSAGVQGLIF